MRYTTRQAGPLAIAGLLAVSLIATQGFDTAGARSSALYPPGATTTGTARVIDGDTIVVGDVKVRLEGIDAPELGQTCGGGWLASWPCGQEAASHLSRLVRDRVVHCDSLGTDAYGRMLGSCTTEGLDLNADMVRNGLAWAFVKYSTRFSVLEADARARRVGIWSGEAKPAWVWRAERWAAAVSERSDAPAGCVIKGNVTRNGHIYHMPWSSWYQKTRVEPARGERWFCSEAEALAAGWRPASTH